MQKISALKPLGRSHQHPSSLMMIRPEMLSRHQRCCLTCTTMVQNFLEYLNLHGRCKFWSLFLSPSTLWFQCKRLSLALTPSVLISIQCHQFSDEHQITRGLWRSNRLKRRTPLSVLAAFPLLTVLCFWEIARIAFKLSRFMKRPQRCRTQLSSVACLGMERCFFSSRQSGRLYLQWNSYRQDASQLQLRNAWPFVG